MKTVTVYFKKTFTLRDDQPDSEPIKDWTKNMGLTYVTHRRIDNENVVAIPIDDLVRYISGGQASSALAARLNSDPAITTIVDEAESGDPHDGAGAHWR